MKGNRLGSSLVAVFVASLLAFPVHAAPILVAEATSGSTAQPAAPSPSTQPAPAQPGTQPYYGPPGTYPPPGAYYPPGTYPQPYYAPYVMPYPQPYYVPAPPVDTRPTVMDYDPSKPIPDGYRLESNSRKGMVVPGAIIFGISYGISLMVAASTTESPPYSSSSYSSSSSGVPFDSAMLYYPVVGPWLALGTLHDQVDCSRYSSSYYSSDYTSCTQENTDLGMWRFMLVVGGLTQTVGAALVLLGVTVRTRQLVLTDNLRASLVPARIGGSGNGLALVGSFGGL
jgi:hypothetical protein